MFLLPYLLVMIYDNVLATIIVHTSEYIKNLAFLHKFIKFLSDILSNFETFSIFGGLRPRTTTMLRFSMDSCYLVDFLVYIMVCILSTVCCLLPHLENDNAGNKKYLDAESYFHYFKSFNSVNHQSLDSPSFSYLKQ